MSAQPFMFTLTEAQQRTLSFDVLCEAESFEKHEPEVLEAARSLCKYRATLEGKPRCSGIDGSAERPTSGGRGAAEPTPMRQTWVAERADKRSASVVIVAANPEYQQGRQP